MKSVFSNQEISIYKAWILGKKNKDIAEELKVSESYISQTLKGINEKINTLQNSIDILKGMGIIEAPELKLNDKGRKSLRKDISKKTLGTKKKISPVIPNFRPLRQWPIPSIPTKPRQIKVIAASAAFSKTERVIPRVLGIIEEQKLVGFPYWLRYEPRDPKEFYSPERSSFTPDLASKTLPRYPESIIGILLVATTMGEEMIKQW